MSESLSRPVLITLLCGTLKSNDAANATTHRNAKKLHGSGKFSVTKAIALCLTCTVLVQEASNHMLFVLQNERVLTIIVLIKPSKT